MLALVDRGGVYPSAAADLCVNEVLLAYLRWAAGYSRGPAGSPARSLDVIKAALKPVRLLFGTTPAGEFGPKCLKAVRAEWVAAGLCRKSVNTRTGIVKRVWKWAAAEELVPVAVFQAVAAVDGLRAGRTDAPDLPPVRPADLGDVPKALPHMPPAVAAIVRVQMHSAARGGELLGMRAADVDRSGAVWSYTPPAHKGSWRGKSRTLYFGNQAQAVLGPYLDAAGGGYVFSPARAEADRLAGVSAARVTPRWPSHMARNERKRKPDRVRKPGERYAPAAYRRAVERACERAGVPVFTPHRLRHLAATRIRQDLGVDVARAMLGHSLAAVTEVYSREVDRTLAMKAVETFG